jgi:hypothetical protein
MFKSTNSTSDNRSTQSINLIDMKNPHKSRQLVTQFYEAHNHNMILLKHLILQKVPELHTHKSCGLIT